MVFGDSSFVDFNKKTFEVFDKKQGNEGGGIPAITEHLEGLLYPYSGLLIYFVASTTLLNTSGF